MGWATEEMWVAMIFFDLSECRGTLVSPYKTDVKSFEERQTLVSRSGNEPTEGQYFADETLHLLCCVRGL